MTKIQILGLTIGWILTIFIGLLAVIILVKVWRNEIDLEYLISDERGYASLSRFQFLIFTFVIAMCLFYLVVINARPEFPPVPNQILALLGISGGSYVMSKGIQSSRDVGITEVTKEAPTEKSDKDADATTETKTETETQTKTKTKTETKTDPDLLGD